MNISCDKNHSGNKHLTRHRGGWECDGCGAYYRELVVTSHPGMTPYATEKTFAAARRSARAAKALGIPCRIVPR